MGMNMRSITLSFVLLLYVSIRTAQSSDGVFDVTTYGAKPNADITQILDKAWKDACASPIQSKLIIPKETYMLGVITLLGPCKSPIDIVVQGTIMAPVDITGDGWIQFRYVDKISLTGGGVFDGQGQKAWERNDCHKNPKCARIPMSLKFSFVKDSIVRDITSKDSKNFHVNILGCKNLTFDHVTINAPGTSINSDGIHMGRCDGVNIINSVIGTGDDCISLGDGSREVTITNVTCGPGHGISVGSLGQYLVEEPVAGLYVKNCTLIGTTNGLRIKTWPASPATGSVTDMHYEDIVLVDVQNPIILDQEYCPYNKCNRKIPSKIKISKVSFKNIRGSAGNAVAVKLLCSADYPCEDVTLSDIDITYTGREGPVVSECSNVKPVVTGIQKPIICPS
ncbi:exopolygalacturonase-like [Cucurbita maxima]|uniref:Exopolygalacturonase-like n=1 Tax=Cucurbita maxima TaxID=3661 RepID=A0A6J1HJP4_CUCMA|nr:exopolygalacturonase-like [Cucurbita maxima]